MSSLRLAEARGVILEWRKPNYDAKRPDPVYWVVEITELGDSMGRVDYERGYTNAAEAWQAWRKKVAQLGATEG